MLKELKTPSIRESRHSWDLQPFTTSMEIINKGSGNPKPLEFTGDRERIRTAGLPLRSGNDNYDNRLKL
jgi:hypothetical protein